MIDAYNAAYRIEDALSGQGYRKRSESHRNGQIVEYWTWSSKSSGASVEVFPATNTSYHHSSRDPLHGLQTPFNVFCADEHNGNVKEAVKAAAAALGMALQRKDVTPICDGLSLAIKTHNLADRLPAGPGSKKVRPVVAAIAARMKKANSLSITAGKRSLASEAGVSPTTVRNVVLLLAGSVFDVTPTEYGYEITLVSKCRLQEFDPLLAYIYQYPIGGQKIENDKNEYSIHIADEPFLTGTSRYMKEFIQNKSIELTIWHDGQLIQAVTPTQVKQQFTGSSAGEGVLLAYDTGLRIGDMTAQEYATEAGIKLSAARAHLRRAESLGLAESEREGSRGPKVYSFIPDFWARIAELAPRMRTYKMHSRREDKRLEAAQQWTKAELEKAKEAGAEEAVEKLNARFDRQVNKRIPHLERLHPDLSMKEIMRMARDVAAYKRNPQTEQAIRTERHAQRIEHRETVALVRDLAIELADVGTPLEEVFDAVMRFGSFDKGMVRSVLQSPKQMANYESLDDVTRRLRYEERTTLPVIEPISPMVNPQTYQLALGGAL